MHCEKEWKEVRRCCGSRRSVGLDWYQRRAFRSGSWKQEEEGRKWAVTGQNRVAIDIGGIHRFIHCIVFGIPGIRHRRINHPMEVAISIPGLISIISPTMIWLIVNKRRGSAVDFIWSFVTDRRPRSGFRDRDFFCDDDAHWTVTSPIQMWFLSKEGRLEKFFSQHMLTNFHLNLIFQLPQDLNSMIFERVEQEGSCG